MLGTVTWARRRNAPGATAYAVVLYAQAWWSAAFIAEQAATGLRAKIAWDDLQYPPMIVASGAILAFAWAYTGRPRGLLPALVAFVVLTAAGGAFVLAEPWHGLLRGEAFLVEHGTHVTLSYPFTVLDHFLVVIVFVGNLTGASTLFSAFRRQHRALRTQAALLAFGIAGPTFLAYAATLSGVTWIGQRDVGPLVFGPFALLTAWALFRERVFDIVPVARDAVIDGLADAVLVVDGKDRVLDANPRAHALLGLAPGDVGRPGVAAPRDLGELLRAASAGDGATVRLGVLDFDVRSSPVGQREQAGVRAVVLRDVTPLHEANRALEAARAQLERRVAERTAEVRERERTLRAIFDHSLQLMGLMAPDGRVLSANQAALALVGAREEDVLGRPFWETPWWTHDPLEQERLREGFARAARGEVVRFPTTHRGKDGRLRSVDFSLTPVPDGAGGVARIVCEGRDVTDQRSLEERLHRTDRLDSMGRLAGSVAHDFNNLLTAIAANAQLAREDLAPGSAAAGALEDLLHAANSATTLTRQLLAFGRARRAEPRNVAVAQALARARPLVERALGPAVRIALSCPEDAGEIRMDSAQLEQILVNLAVNARDAMPGGGSFTVTVEHRDLAPDEAAARGTTPGPCVLLRVGDDGPGMPEHVRERAFDPFFTTKAEGKGTGLGLASVYGVVRNHGGAIELESAPGRGTRFEILLPRVDPHGGAPASPDSGA